jgi:hypothetical protein
MADNSNINRDNQPNVAEDDPFAELARIMNQGGRAESPAPAEEAEPEADPFAVDLEQELLGDLDDVDAAYASEEASEPQFEASEDDAPLAYDADDTPAEPEPESWQAGSHDQFDRARPAGDDYWTNAEPLTDQPSEPVAEEPEWQTAPVHSDVEDAMLADVDMDFGDLDVPAEEPVAETEDQIEAVEDMADEPQPADAEVSLEDELEMLLAGGAPAPQDNHAAADEADYAAQLAFPEPETQPRSSIFSRANFSGGYAEEHAGGHEPAAEDYPAVEDHEEAQVEEIEPESDPLAALSSIAPEISQPVRAAAAEFPSDLETVEVPESTLAQEDDLNLPDLPREEPAGAGLVDDFETDFAYDFPAPQPVAEEPARKATDADADPVEDEDRFYAEALGFGAAAGAARRFDTSEDDLFDSNVDRELNEALSMPDAFAIPAEDKPQRRNGFLIAGVVVGVALIGGIGAFALSFGGGDPGGPVLVEADNDPMKVKPDNPGGATEVPNQDSVAYEAATGGNGNRPPQQESLVTTTEEPVNIASRTVDTGRVPGVDDQVGGDGASGKAEDRLQATTGAAPELAEDVIAVQPRRVRTMIVRPDGTLVPREDAAPEQAAAPRSAETAVAEQPATAAAAQEIAPEQTETVAPAEEQPAIVVEETPEEPTTLAAVEAPVEEIVETPASTEPEVEQAAAAQTTDLVTPRVGPVAPSRPAQQDATEQRVAQAATATTRTQPAAPAPVAAAGSEWSMQIASQPTAESAQTTYQELARRYGNLLDGRGVNIVRADIPGKGTYFRVRIPTSSRNDGIELCERYKAAGGSCFVSK